MTKRVHARASGTLPCLGCWNETLSNIRATESQVVLKSSNMGVIHPLWPGAALHSPHAIAVPDFERTKARCDNERINLLSTNQAHGARQTEIDSYTRSSAKTQRWRCKRKGAFKKLCSSSLDTGFQKASLEMEWGAEFDSYRRIVHVCQKRS